MSGTNVPGTSESDCLPGTSLLPWDGHPGALPGERVAASTWACFLPSERGARLCLSGELACVRRGGGSLHFPPQHSWGCSETRFSTKQSFHLSFICSTKFLNPYYV